MSKNDNKIIIPESLSVSSLADVLGKGPSQIIAHLFKNGVMVTINEMIDFDTAAIVASDMGFDPVLESRRQVRPSDQLIIEKEYQKQARIPVISVMGHVDHGKTTLLDAIRQTDQVSLESGGITQNLSAYKIKVNHEDKEREITFLDTPGHEAFAVLREHGIRATDLIVLVVAADDGVKPQTIEIIKLANKMQMPIIVALNKIDSPRADVHSSIASLAEHGLIAESLGGNVPVVEISAKLRKGIDKLLDIIFIMADIGERQVRFAGPATGLVLESHTKSGLGLVATLLIEEGSLKPNDIIVTGNTYAKIKTMTSTDGKKITKALPATPVVVSGLKQAPGFGDWFEEVPSEAFAKDWVFNQIKHSSVKSMVKSRKLGVSDLDLKLNNNKVNILPIIIKADSAGSLETLSNTLQSLGGKSVAIKVVASSIGNISESDISLSQTTKALILGFNSTISSQINQLARRSGVQFRLYKVIYDLIDDIQDLMYEIAGDEEIEELKAELSVQGVFSNNKKQITCGGEVISGIIETGLVCHIYSPESELKAKGKLISLRKEKNESPSAHKGELCGLQIEIDDLLTNPKNGDKIKFFALVKRQREL